MARYSRSCSQVPSSVGIWSSRVERVWGNTEGSMGSSVEQVARWKWEPLTPARREVVERLCRQVTALGELLSAIVAWPRSFRPGTIDRKRTTLRGPGQP